MAQKELNKVEEKIKIFKEQVEKKEGLYKNDVIPKQELIDTQNGLKLTKID